MIKSLLFLLLLPGCGQKTESLPLGKAPSENLGAKSPAPEGYPYETPEENEEVELIPLSRHEISSYLSPKNPYHQEYEDFFQSQFKLYGSDDSENPIVSLGALLELGYRRNVYLCGGSGGDSLLVISNGLTNLYPLPPF